MFGDNARFWLKLFSNKKYMAKFINVKFGGKFVVMDEIFLKEKRLTEMSYQ